MKDKCAIAIGVCILIFFAGCGSKTERASTPEGSVIVTRVLPSQVKAGEPFTVSLTMVVNGKVNAVGIEERYPAGWTVSNVPLKGVLKSGPSRIEWLFWPMGEPIINRTFNYTVVSPVGYVGSAEFAGKVITRGTYLIEGDTTVKVAS